MHSTEVTKLRCLNRKIYLVALIFSIFQLNSVQGKLEDEQQRHDYRSQLNDIKSQCDESFAAIEESHAKQVPGIVIRR